MNSKMSSHSGQTNDDCMHAVQGNWGALKIKWLLSDSFARDCRLSLLWQWIWNHWSCLFFTLAFKSLSLRTSLMMKIASHSLFSDMGFGGPNIHLVGIKWSLHWRDRVLRPLWVSAVHGWAGVAGHFVESLSRISLLRFSISSCSSFDRARCSRSYFRIWNQRSKHTTQAISSSVMVIIGQVYSCMVWLCWATFHQWTVDMVLTVWGIIVVVSHTDEA